MSAQTVRELLDGLAAGRCTLEQVCADFAARAWPARPRPTIAQAYGVHDTIPDDDPDSWSQVANDSRLTPGQYAALFTAVDGGTP